MIDFGELRLDSSIPEKIVVGLGVYQVIEGSIPKGSELAFSFEGEIEKTIDHTVEYFPADERQIRFHARIEWTLDLIGKEISISAQLTQGNNRIEHSLGLISLVRPTIQPVKAFQWPGDAPLVSICMATYNPPSEPFRRQIETILMQSHKNWSLLIVDDGSDVNHLDEMRLICSADQQRIHLIEHVENVGFYHNFERALSYVPEEASYVAFADQDDLWYPEKLEKLIQAVEAEKAVLAYSDMRIVQESGEVVSSTYWRGRKNEYKDMTTVFLANTVTGAAALFKKELINSLLPFPQRIGDAFHDHWLALVAMNQGKLAYVDEPLYDYYQYGDSVIGHCDFERWSFTARLRSIVKLVLRVFRPRQAKQWLGQKIGAGIAIYRGECLRLSLFSQTLKLRSSEQGPRLFMHTLNLCNGGLASFAKLMIVHLKILMSGKTTDDAEFRLGLAYMAREYERRKQ